MDSEAGSAGKCRIPPVWFSAWGACAVTYAAFGASVQIRAWRTWARVDNLLCSGARYAGTRTIQSEWPVRFPTRCGVVGANSTQPWLRTSHSWTAGVLRNETSDGTRLIARPSCPVRTWLSKYPRASSIQGEGGKNLKNIRAKTKAGAGVREGARLPSLYRGLLAS